MKERCQALCDDYERPAYHASMQRIICPDEKPCSRRAKEQVKHLSLCTVHARLAREGLVQESGRVATRPDIATVRRHPKKFPRGLYSWAQDG